MSQRPADIEREINRRRQELSRHIDALNERVRGGVEDARDAFDERVDELVSRAKIDECAEQRPLLTLASAFGVGVLLGAITDPGSSSDSGDRRRGGRRQPGDGALSDLLGALTGALGSSATVAVQDEVRTAIRSVFHGDRPQRARAGDEAATETNGHGGSQVGQQTF